MTWLASLKRRRANETIRWSCQGVISSRAVDQFLRFCKKFNRQEGKLRTWIKGFLVTACWRYRSSCSKRRTRNLAVFLRWGLKKAKETHQECRALSKKGVTGRIHRWSQSNHTFQWYSWGKTASCTLMRTASRSWRMQPFCFKLTTGTKLWIISST